MTSVHHLKTASKPFEAVARGLKTAEIRKNDRRFQVGDTIVLHELVTETLQGAWYVKAEITHILHDNEAFGGLFPGAVMLSFKVTEINAYYS